MGDANIIEGDYQFKALHLGNPIQRFWHYSKQLAISRFLPPSCDDFVLDIGCGSGVVSRFLSDRGAKVLGIDANPAAIEFASRTYGSSSVRFQLGYVDESIELDRQADKIYCLELIEHIYLHQARDMLNLFSGMLKPGGRVLLTTPNYLSLWPVIEWGMDKLHLAPTMEEHQHVTHYTGSRLERLCRETGFRIEILSSFCLLSPWVALANWKLAEYFFGIECSLPLKWGSVLIIVMSKETSS